MNKEIINHDHDARKQGAPHMDMDWFIILYGVIVVAIFIAVIMFSLRQYRTIKQLMTDQAMKRNGTVEGSYFLPRLKFPYKNLQVLVTSVPGSRYRQPKTEASATITKPLSGTLTIYRESVATRFGKLLGAEDIRLGSDEFDREYMIKADDQQFVKNLLNYQVQSKLLELKYEKPHVTLYGTWLTVSIPKVLKNEEQYDRLFDLTFTFIDRADQL